MRAIDVVFLVALVFGWLSLGPRGGAPAPAAEPAAEVASPAEVHGADTHAGEGEHAEEGHEAAAGSTNPVTVDPDLAVVTAIIFLVLLAVLWKFAWGPIVAALDQRERTVADQLAEAKRSQDEAQRMLADHQTRLAGAAAEVKQLMDQARRDADIQRQQLLESAQAAAAAEKDRAVREIQAAKHAALEELASKSVATAVDLAGQIVRRQLRPEDHSQLISDALDQFSSNN
jgi:F-type H+-transporting ATPase subunit b